MSLCEKSEDEEFKLIVTVLEKEKSSVVVEASKGSGAEGATIILGQGSCASSMLTDFFYLCRLKKKEILLTLVESGKIERVLKAIVDAGHLEEPGNGYTFVINVKSLIGMTHSYEKEDCSKSLEGIAVTENSNTGFDLIVTIINKGFAEEVIDASKKVGAEGGTIISGRGTGIHENAKLFGIPIEPEKEIVLTLIRKEKSACTLKAISEAVNIEKPGNGIAFVIDVEKAIGIQHLLTDHKQ